MTKKVSNEKSAKPKKKAPLDKRTSDVLKGLKRGFTYRRIQEVYGIPKSTAFDIAVRHDAYSKYSIDQMSK